MKRIHPDLWQTSTERPIPDSQDAAANAYLLIRSEGNILIYGTGREEAGDVDDDADLDQIARLGGVAWQLIGHWHEASASIGAVKRRFGATLACHAREAPMVEKVGGVRPDHTFWEEGVVAGDVRVIPTPGHTVGSASYFYRSPHGQNYLFTGDTIVPAKHGWLAGAFEDDPRQSNLRRSLDTLGAFDPTTVLAAGGLDGTYRQVRPEEWAGATASVKENLT